MGLDLLRFGRAAIDLTAGEKGSLALLLVASLGVYGSGLGEELVFDPETVSPLGVSRVIFSVFGSQNHWEFGWSLAGLAVTFVVRNKAKHFTFSFFWVLFWNLSINFGSLTLALASFPLRVLSPAPNPARSGQSPSTQGMLPVGVLLIFWCCFDSISSEIRKRNRSPGWAVLPVMAACSIAFANWGQPFVLPCLILPLLWRTARPGDSSQIAASRDNVEME